MLMRFKLVPEPIDLELTGKDEKEILEKLKYYLENAEMSDCKILVERPEYETY